MKLHRLMGLSIVALAAFSLILSGNATAQPFVQPCSFANSCVMNGLDNPRGLAWDDGTLYVAEAGRGGTGPCTALDLPRTGLACYGPTGAVSRLRRGRQRRIAEGLPSYIVTPSNDVTGPHDVSLRDDRIFVALGLGGGPAFRNALHPDFGWIIRLRNRHSYTRVTDIAGYEFTDNPDQGPLDSNPFGLLPRAGGRIVVDAGGNSLLSVGGNGQVSTIAVFQPRPDHVPTAVTLDPDDPDDAYYVSQLTGAPFTPGTARVFRVVPGQAYTVYRSGFTQLIDLQFGPDGNLYVLQHGTEPFFSGPGSLIRIAPDGTPTVVVTGLNRPTSFVIVREDDDEGDDDDGDDKGGNTHAKGDNGDDDDGDVDEGRLTFYITNCGVCIGTGEVIKIQP